MPNPDHHILLVVTVGGAAETVVAAVLAQQPARILFVCSGGTRPTIDSPRTSPERDDSGGVVQRLADVFPLDPGRYDICEVSDPQDLQGMVEILHREVTPRLDAWVTRGSAFHVVLDFTGGTKCMSVAVGLMSRVWPCQLQYIGGDLRNKEGVGVVVSGREQVLVFQQPWNSLGFQVAEEAAILHDQGDVAAAEALVVRARNESAPGRMKEGLTTLAFFLGGYVAWDRFDHDTAARLLGKAVERTETLSVLLTPGRVRHLLRCLEADRRRLDALIHTARPSWALIVDLLANAARRLREARYDDATGRVYRAIEATAQWHLWDEFQVETNRVTPAQVPRDLRERWAWTEGVCMVGLQDAWELLHALRSEHGRPLDSADRFRSLALHDRHKSPLSLRNSSILAHGFTPIAEAPARKLFAAALALTGLQEQDLHRFPCLRA